jgi:hypothetical protein
MLPFARLLRNALYDPEQPTEPSCSCPHGHFYEQLEQGLRLRLSEVIEEVLAQANSLDKRLPWYRITADRAGQISVTLGAEPAQRINTVIDGNTRPAYRCGGSPEGNGFRWLDLPTALLDNFTDTGTIPVYIQSHTLERLRQRLPVPLGAIHHGLTHSLACPLINRQDNETFLIEYRLHEELRVGYLVARRLANTVILTTFLLITMQGTPGSGTTAPTTAPPEAGHRTHRVGQADHLRQQRPGP